MVRVSLFIHEPRLIACVCACCMCMCIYVCVCWIDMCCALCFLCLEHVCVRNSLMCCMFVCLVFIPFSSHEALAIQLQWLSSLFAYIYTYAVITNAPKEHAVLPVAKEDVSACMCLYGQSTMSAWMVCAWEGGNAGLFRMVVFFFLNSFSCVSWTIWYCSRVSASWRHSTDTCVCHSYKRKRYKTRTHTYLVVHTVRVFSCV